MSVPFRLTLTGKLIAARVFELKTLSRADEYASELAATLAQVPMVKRPVLCADHRPVVIYPQEVADRLVQLFSRMNERLERVAILVAPSNATLLLQLGRIVREARFADRRVFTGGAEASTWLAPALTAEESTRVEQFLAELATTSR